MIKNDIIRCAKEKGDLPFQYIDILRYTDRKYGKATNIALIYLACEELEKHGVIRRQSSDCSVLYSLVPR